MSIAAELVLYGGCLPATPFGELVDAAAAAGFDAITVWPLMYRRALSREGWTPEAMAAALVDAGIRATDLDPCGDWLATPPAAGDRPNEFRAVWDRHDFFATASVLGADSIVAVDLGGVREVPVGQAIEGFAELCDDAAEHGLRVALEFLSFSGIPDLATGWRVVADADRPNGAIVLDVCHLERGGWDEATLRSIPPERIAAVQLADGPARAPADLVHEAMFERQLAGEGEMPVADVLGVLADMGVRTRVGPELYRRGWSTRPASEVAADLAAATRSLLL